jgi:hypothetical protein
MTALSEHGADQVRVVLNLNTARALGLNALLTR